MNGISIYYTFTHTFKYDTNYCWSENGELFNTKTGKEVKKVYNGGCLGYWINRKFYSQTKLNKDKLIRKINHIDLIL